MDSRLTTSSVAVGTLLPWSEEQATFTTIRPLRS